MKERPILLNGHDVRAILNGWKTQTRRSVNEHPPDPGFEWNECLCKEIDPSDTPCPVCFSRFGPPPGEAGDRLWVRETWQEQGDGVLYRAGDSKYRPQEGVVRWRASIHMPRWASRLTLEVTNVRVERLQDISEDDAKAEGFPGALIKESLDSAGLWFADLWNTLAKPGTQWKDNPWVWAVTFRKVTT